ncbi:hypothetical protein [Denitromonas ohlonensis]
MGSSANAGLFAREHKVGAGHEAPTKAARSMNARALTLRAAEKSDGLGHALQFFFDIPGNGLDLARDLVNLAFLLKVLVANKLPGSLLKLALHRFDTALHLIFVHVLLLGVAMWQRDLQHPLPGTRATTHSHYRRGSWPSVRQRPLQRSRRKKTQRRRLPVGLTRKHDQSTPLHRARTLSRLY